MASSFKKKQSSKPSHPRGCRPSLYNAQLLASSGVPAMDSLLGGGLAVGTVLLVEEDTYASYSRLLLKYFFSEGVMCGHTLFMASASGRTEDILKDLPAATNDEQLMPRPQQQQLDPGKATPTAEERPSPDTSEPMKIAWRYQSLPQVQLSFSSQFGHSYDLTVAMPTARIEAVKTFHFNALEKSASSTREMYLALKNSIEAAIHDGHFSVDEVVPKQRNLLRIGLQSLGSPLWLDEGAGGVADSAPNSLLQFLHCLRALLRRAYAVAMVTVPTHLMQDSAYVRRIHRICDSVVQLESFAGSDKETNPVFKDFHGLFHIHKFPCLNSLTTHHTETADLAFKLKRKKFSIERLHLPPELSETTGRAQEDVMSISRSNIGSEAGKKPRTKLSKKDIEF